MMQAPDRIFPLFQVDVLPLALHHFLSHSGLPSPRDFSLERKIFENRVGFSYQAALLSSKNNQRGVHMPPETSPGLHSLWRKFAPGSKVMCPLSYFQYAAPTK